MTRQPGGDARRGGGAPPLVGVVLAGGRATRLPGKLAADLGGRPLVAWPVAALGAVCDRVAVVCKPDTELPQLDAERWDEPPEPHHPVAGLVHALERAETPVVVCAADMPFVTPAALAAVAAALRGNRAAVACAGGRLQPLLAAYAPSALPALSAAAPDARLTEVVAALAPVEVEVGDGEAANVNTTEDLEAARTRVTKITERVLLTDDE